MAGVYKVKQIYIQNNIMLFILSDAYVMHIDSK